MKEILDLSLGEFIGRIFPQETFGDDLIIVELDDKNMPKREVVDFQPMRLEAHSVILALQGEMKIDLDYISYVLKKDMVLEVIAEDIIENISFSGGFQGYHIMFSRNLLSEVITPLIGQLPKGAGQAKRAFPAQHLDPYETQNILDIISRMKRYITDKGHLYREQIIRNELSSLILELDNGTWKRYGKELAEMGTNESIAFRFRQLLNEYCRQEHEVAFYAGKLNVTPDHLSKVMRAFSGRSAVKWINHAIVTEAKLLLRKPDMNIQQVSDALYFADQSTFGKFFKKHTGCSPSQYRFKAYS